MLHGTAAAAGRLAAGLGCDAEGPRIPLATRLPLAGLAAGTWASKSCGRTSSRAPGSGRGGGACWEAALHPSGSHSRAPSLVEDFTVCCFRVFGLPRPGNFSQGLARADAAAGCEWPR